MLEDLEWTSMEVEEASRLFSINSLMMAEGRWMTSPAAMRSIVWGGRGRIGRVVIVTLCLCYIGDMVRSVFVAYAAALSSSVIRGL